ncbi:hypothetical protein FSP39_008331 [Pinctada imbricata]|uniref:Uncharacterized protein n=1 Tax=Pinctada imbricata TaxID=66713 RepID=A0AA88YE28_PINIB|nr:hypothetical protein FSP39_008331 [Pinctada imbricata]
MEYSIRTTWDQRPITHSPIQITLSKEDKSPEKVKVTVQGQFFNDPPNPGGKTGEAFPGLWDFEVAEVFFLNDNNQYLEVELSPHGQHLVLLLKAERDAFKTELPLEYTATITGDQWIGTAYIPCGYFPPRVSKFNAYAIHGAGENRVYQSLYPVPTGKYKNPDFHRLDYFADIDLKNLLPQNWAASYHSDLWRPIIGTKSFSISTTWDGHPINHDPITLQINKLDDKDQVKVIARGPLFNDPQNPGGVPGQPFDQLWDYEVAEAFFLNEENQYLEVELCPHGQHLVLLLKGRRDSFKTKLPMNYTATITKGKWEGVAYIPAEYFPPKVSKFNAYAIHGSGSDRVYQSLYPTPKDKYTDPDFHRLEYFQQIHFEDILPSNWMASYKSDLWNHQESK